MSPAGNGAKLDQAIALLEKRGDDPPACVDLAEALLRRGLDPERSGEEQRQDLERASQLDPYRESIAFHLGRLHHREERCTEALAAYRQALDLHPTSDRVQRHLALLYLDTADRYSQAGSKAKTQRNQAIDMAAELLAALPKHTPSAAWGPLGLIECDLRRGTQAKLRSDLEANLRAIDPQSGTLDGVCSALTRVVVVLKLDRKKKKLYAQAEKTLRTLVKVVQERWLPAFPEHPVLSAIADLVELRLTSDLLMFLTLSRTLRARGVLPELVSMITVERIQENKPEEHLGILREELSGSEREFFLDPFLRQANETARTRLRRGDAQGAVELWRECQEHDPFNPSILQNIAVGRLALGDPDVALQAWADVLWVWGVHGGVGPDKPAVLRMFRLRAQAFAEQFEAAFDNRHKNNETADEADYRVWVRERVWSLVLEAVELRPGNPLAKAIVNALFGSINAGDLLAKPVGKKFLSLMKPGKKPPPFDYDRLGVRKDAKPSQIRERFNEEKDKVIQLMKLEPDPSKLARFREMLDEREAAFAVLSDPKKRRIYDRGTCSAEEHQLSSRVLDLAMHIFRWGLDLSKAKKRDCIPLFVGVFQNLPLDPLTPYFEEEEPGLLDIVKEGVDSLTIAPYIEKGDEYVEKEELKKALTQYRKALQLAPNSARAHWEAAQCEFRLEIEFIKKKGVPSGDGPPLIHDGVPSQGLVKPEAGDILKITLGPDLSRLSPQQRKVWGETKVLIDRLHGPARALLQQAQDDLAQALESGDQAAIDAAATKLEQIFKIMSNIGH